MSTQQPSSVPRIPPTNIYADNINWFLAALWPGGLARRVRLVLTYEDGTTESIDSHVYSVSAGYFEWVVNKATAVEKKVTKLVLHGVVGNTQKPLMEWVGDVDNPVFDVGDNISFKVRFNTTYQVA